MDAVLYDLLHVALSAVLSWFITHRYYPKSIENQDKENAHERAALIEALEEKKAADSTLLTQKYIDTAVDAWKRGGTSEHYLNSLELPNEEKAKIFRAAASGTRDGNRKGTRTFCDAQITSHCAPVEGLGR